MKKACYRICAYALIFVCVLMFCSCAMEVKTSRYDNLMEQCQKCKEDYMIDPYGAIQKGCDILLSSECSKTRKRSEKGGSQRFQSQNQHEKGKRKIAVYVKKDGKKEKKVIVLYHEPGAKEGTFTILNTRDTELAKKKGEIKSRENLQEYRRVTSLGVVPRRVIPFVLRVWIAPWRDDHDRLKWSRMVYIDLPINKWNLGVKPSLEKDREILRILSTWSEGKVLYFNNRSGNRSNRSSRPSRSFYKPKRK